MKNSDIQLKGGENIQYHSTVLMSLGKNIPKLFRNEFTDGKFFTKDELNRIIRKNKLNQLFKK